MRTLKKLLLVAFIFVVLIGGVFIYIKLTPPLLIGTIAKSEDQQTVIIGLGNKGFSALQVEDVKVNNHTSPDDTKIQVSNALAGFVLTDDENNASEKNIEYKNVDEVTIEKGTIPKEIFAKQDEGTATAEDPIYGLTVKHYEEIHNVHIIYRYFGIQLSKTISLD